MQARARIRYLRVSPKKMRRVGELIKGKQVEEALNILNYTPKIAAHHLAKTVKAAAANAIAGVGTAKLKAEDLAITKVAIDNAPTAKRVRFQSMGRVYRIRKRFCHVTIEVEGEPEPEETKTARRRAEKAEKPVSVKSRPKRKKTAVKPEKPEVKEEKKAGDREEEDVSAGKEEELTEAEPAEAESDETDETKSES
jgi:large subunit ribosomal protein L22